MCECVRTSHVLTVYLKWLHTHFSDILSSCDFNIPFRNLQQVPKSEPTLWACSVQRWVNSLTGGATIRSKISRWGDGAAADGWLGCDIIGWRKHVALISVENDPKQICDQIGVFEVQQCLARSAISNHHQKLLELPLEPAGCLAVLNLVLFTSMAGLTPSSHLVKDHDGQQPSTVPERPSSSHGLGALGMF